MGQREHELCLTLNVRPEGIHDKFKSLVMTQKQLEKQVAELAARLASTSLEDLFRSPVEVNGIKVIAAKIALESPQTLREVGDRVRDQMGSGVAVLGGVLKEKVALLAIVSHDLTDKISAGVLVGKVAAMVGGKGGGRADMAQAGGPMIDQLSGAISAVPECVRKIVAG